MSKGRRLLLALSMGGFIAACGVVPVPMLDGELIVMEVTNQSPRPATLVVAAPGQVREVVGSVDPAIVPAGGSATVRFLVPATGHWSIWANDGELMGHFDIGKRRGHIPMGIDIGPDGSPSWWCKNDCP